MTDRSTQTRQAPDFDAHELAQFVAFGVGDLARVEEAGERIVRLSPRSSIVCPLHERELRPDACRSCRLLAVEVRS